MRDAVSRLSRCRGRRATASSSSGAARGPRTIRGGHQGVIVEDERAADGGRARIATVLPDRTRVPWRCAMCDLWRYTTAADTPRGAIPAQIAAARAALRDAAPSPSTGMKLYNAGSFFDPRAVPDADYDASPRRWPAVARDRRVASRARRARAWIGCSPRSIVIAARWQPAPQLEVAMGLETAHPDALDRLNKRFTLDDFDSAADALADRGVALRVFLLISPPFVPLHEQDAWLLRSIDAAFACGASVVSLMPTRPGNGAMEALADGRLVPRARPRRHRAQLRAGAHARASAGAGCSSISGTSSASRTARTASSARRDRLHAMNLEQRVLPLTACSAGEHRAHA